MRELEEETNAATVDARSALQLQQDTGAKSAIYGGKGGVELGDKLDTEDESDWEADGHSDEDY
jgi:hypothetical protein